MSFSKVGGLFMKILVLILPVIGVQNILADVTLKITDDYNDAKVKTASVVFQAPGDQKLTIENHLQKDIDMGNIIFVGDEFTAPLVARDLATQGYSGCSTVKSGTSCSLVLNVRDNASPTINPGGELLLLNYRVSGEEENKFAGFKVKIDYNNGVIFKVRNLEFTQYNMSAELLYPCVDPVLNNLYNVHKESTRGGYVKFSPPQKLTILNENSQAIKVTNIRFAKEELDLTIGDFSGCAHVSGGGSCEVGVSINNLNTSDRTIPIYVVYDVLDENNGVVKKDLLAIAAAIINLDPKLKEPETRIGHAFLSGVVTGADIVAFFKGAVKATEKVGNYAKKRLFTAVIENKAAGAAAEFLTDSLLGVGAGTSYSIVDSFFDDSTYKSDKNINKLFDAGFMHIGIGLGFCAGDLSCIMAQIGCGLLGSFGAKFLGQILYSNVTMRLPEQTWYETLKNKSQTAFGFGASAVIRLGCKGVTGFLKDGVLEFAREVYTDTFSGATMDVISYLKPKKWLSEKMFGSNVKLPDGVKNGKNGTALADDICYSRDCACSYLSP